MRFDWKGGLLVCGGFLLGIAALYALQEGPDLELDEHGTRLVGLVPLGGPVAGRRAVFSAPQLAEPRSGVLASLLSIVWLLATIFGLQAFGGGVVGGRGGSSRPPTSRRRRGCASRPPSRNSESVSAASRSLFEPA